MFPFKSLAGAGGVVHWAFTWSAHLSIPCMYHGLSGKITDPDTRLPMQEQILIGQLIVASTISQAVF